jgi:hypothetical protein
MLAGPLTSASSFIRPWQVGQASTSTAKVRAKSSAQGAVAPRVIRPTWLGARRGQHARVADGVQAWWGHAGGQPAQQRPSLLLAFRIGRVFDASVEQVFQYDF